MSVASRLNKLRTMSAAEVGSRIAAVSYRWYERRAIRAGQDSPRFTGQPAAGPAPIFFPSARDHDATRRALTTHYSSETESSIQRAEAVVNGRVCLFGQDREIGDTVDWHRDPVSGRRWPLVYHGDVPVGDRQQSPGDAKHVWELNRHVFLLDLAKAYLVTRDERYRTVIERLVHSWIEQNPYAVGINWAGALEVAYRALSWMWVFALTNQNERGADSNVAWLSAFEAHGRFLHRHLELYESPYNHLIGEAAVLYALGLMFPQAAESARWRRRGRRILESRLQEQFYADGGSVEQASGYHHATLGFYLLAAMLGRLNGDELSPAVWTAIERGIAFSMHLMQPDGLQPALGDNDDARPLAFSIPSSFDFRHFQAAGAVLFNRPDFKGVAAGFPEDAFWLLGVDGLERFARMDSRTPDQASVALEQSGYVVLRSDWSEHADYVCFDCGEQAGGLRTDGIPSAAHGHADALAVVAQISGTPLLVDSGFYCYDGELDWERHFRETAAHNTIRIDGRDQATHLDRMAWTHVPTVTLEGYGVDGGERWATASHDGYAKPPHGVVHRRTVHLRRRYLVICDEVVGEGSHMAEVLFHFAPGLDVALNGAQASIGSHHVLAWRATPAVRASVSRGGAGPAAGWNAPRLGQRVAACRLVLDAAFTSPGFTVISVLADARIWTLSGAAGTGAGGVLTIALSGADSHGDDYRDGRRARDVHQRARLELFTSMTMARAGGASRRPAKILEICSYPPPRGGWSMRVEFVKKQLEADGHACVVLNTGPSRRIPNPEYETVMDPLDFVRKVWKFSRAGFVLHAHVNGDSSKGFVRTLLSQIINLASGERGCLTFHAGVDQIYFPRQKAPALVPLYWLMFAIPRRIICNSDAVKAKIEEYGVKPEKIVPIPAFTRQYLEFTRGSPPGGSRSPLHSF